MTLSTKKPATPSASGPVAERSARRAASQLRDGGVPSGGYAVQRKALAPENAGYDAQAAELAPVQAHGGNVHAGRGDVHAAAAHGTRGAGGTLPHQEAIQASFGRHDVSGVQAYTGGAATEASDAMGATAYATGDKVAFKGAPDLHTAAHEAAHVVQQRGGVSLYGGVGAAGDRYEQHADAVADKVVAGQSAEALLDTMSGAGGGAGAGAVQRKDEPQKDGNEEPEDDSPWYHPNKADGGGEVKRQRENKSDGPAGSEKTTNRSVGAGISIKDGKLVGTLSASAGLSYTWPVGMLGPAMIKVGLGGGFSAAGEASGDGIKAELKGQLTAKLQAGLAMDLLVASLEGGLTAAGSLGVTLKDGELYVPKGIEAGLSGDLKLVLALGGTWIEAVKKSYPEWVAELKTEVEICKGDLVKVSSKGFFLTKEGSMVWGTPPGFKVTYPGLKKLGEFYDKWIARKPELLEAKAGLGDAISARFNAIDFGGIEQARQKVTTFGAELPERLEALKVLSESPTSGEYAAEYTDLYADLKSIKAGLSDLEKMLIGDQKGAAREELGHLRKQIGTYEAQLFLNPLPTPGEREAGVAATNQAHDKAEARKAKTKVLTVSGNILQGKTPEERFPKGSQAFNGARVANQYFFNGNVAMKKGQYAKARDLYEKSWKEWKDVPGMSKDASGS